GWLGAILKWAVAIGVALVVLVVIRLIVWVVGWRRDEPAPTPPSRPIEAIVASADDVPDVPSEDLLGAAEQALSQGRFPDAVLLARGASLRRLGEAGKVRLHRARTDREYLRAVRGDASVHGPLAEILASVEGHR